MPKVLFVYHNELEEGFMPASLAVLGGVMKAAGVESKLFDTSFWKDKNSKIKENDRQVREKTGEFKKVSGFNPEREVVDLKEKFLEVVEEFKPDLIAATSTSYEFNSLIDFMLPAKNKFNILVIVGGSHTTVAPEKAIQKEGVDIVCVGEGEKALLELAKRIEQKQSFNDIPNLWVKTPAGEVIKNDVAPQIEMDDLPEPDWDLFDARHRARPFEGELKNYGFFEISRGCPFSCSYCINAKLHEIYRSFPNSKLFRFHSPEEIVRRIKKFKEKYSFNHIQFVDENLSVMPLETLKKLADLYSKEIGVGFFMMARPEGIVAEPEKAKIFAKMGCRMAALGAESGNEALKKAILNRPMKNETLEKAAKLLKDAGILVSIYNIIGFPTETKEMIFDTIRLNRKIQPDRYSVRFLVPYPGTAIRKYCEEKGYIDPDYEETIGNVSFLIEPVLNLPSPPHPTKQELMDIKMNWKNYLKMSDEEFEKIARNS